MLLVLALLGIFIGFFSGFFGIGGGTMLVPVLLYLGFDMKVAIGISILQMVFSSIFGSYLNYKKDLLEFQTGLKIGFGGVLGGLGSGFLVEHLSNTTLGIIFLLFVFLSIIKFFTSPPVYDVPHKDAGIVFVLIGFVVGLFAMSVGVGGSILITPILASFFRYDLKKAVAVGLFFVIFSSIAGVISLSYFGHMDYQSGFILGIFSLLGVYLGINAAYKTNAKRHKHLILILYIIIFAMMFNKIFF